ncbi:hypothetical protein Aduo_005822 [Ancylostoma duodenale]
MVYDDITDLLAKNETCQESFERIKKMLASPHPLPSPRETHKEIVKLHYDMQSIVSKMDCNLAVGDMLWEIYDMLEEANLDLEESRHDYQHRRRGPGRLHNGDINRFILQKEKERIQELLPEVANMKVEALIEQPERESIGEQLDRIENMVFAAAPEGSQAGSSKMTEILEQLKKIAVKTS